MKKKLFKNIKKEFIELIEDGKNYKYISEKLNISKSTYYAWKKMMKDEPSRREILDEASNLTDSLKEAMKGLSKINLQFDSFDSFLEKIKELNNILEPVFKDAKNIKETIKNNIEIEEFTNFSKQIETTKNKVKAIEECKFSTIRQGTATNTLTKVKTNEKRNVIVDPITKIAKITQGDFCITIPEFTKFTGFKTSTYQLLDALTTTLTETGARSPSVILSLEEYMKKRNLKDKKEARKQVADDLEALFNATISFKEKTKQNKEMDFQDIRIIDSKGISKGIINVSFGITFYKILSGYPVMPYPAQLWTINSKKNPNSFYLLRKIAEHKNMNIGKKNEDIISIKALLTSTPNLPLYEEVIITDKHSTRRIIEPFERDMNVLRETLTWTYCHNNNLPLTSEEIKNLDYNTFIRLLVKINWNQYPHQVSRIDEKSGTENN